MQRNNQADVLKILSSLGIEKKANEANSTGQAGYGAELVPTDVASEIIKKARTEDTLFGQLPAGQVIEMPTNPYKIPVEGADPIFYHTSEEPNVPGTAVPTSKVGTGSLTLTAKKFSASVYLSGELDEDARVAGGMQGFITDKLGLAYSELIDKAMINGDIVTAATGNVNSDDGAPAAGSYYLAFDGLVKKALAQGAAGSFSAGTLDTGDFITGRSKLGRYGARPNDLLAIMNTETYYKMLSLAQVETAEKFSGATIENGVLTKVYGMDIIVHPDLGLAEADGKQSVTGASNTLGRFLIVHKPSMIFGWRRKMKITVKYLDETDQYRLTAHTRFTFNLADAAQRVAMGYNITV